MRRSRMFVMVLSLGLLLGLLGANQVYAGRPPAPAAPPDGGCFTFTRTLQRGMAGRDVRELQIRVAGWAADTTTQTYVIIDGIFGSGTEAAVIRFQNAYGLTANGIVDAATQSQLYALEDTDCTTIHFDWSEFYSPDCGCFSGGMTTTRRVQEGVRRLMWKLEAVRQKNGSNPIYVTSGFRTIAYNEQVGGASNSMHLYGVAADVIMSGWSLDDTELEAGKAGFSGIIGPPDASHLDHVHVDSRIEYPYGAQFWYWPTMWSLGAAGTRVDADWDR